LAVEIVVDLLPRPTMTIVDIVIDLILRPTTIET